MVVYSVPTKTFIRGKIEKGEKFFILAQTEYFPNRFSQNSVVINYVSSKRDGFVTFTSLYGEKNPLYFNHSVKKGGLYLSVDGKNITKYPIKFSPGRNVDTTSLYSGVWYHLYLEPTFESVPWDILGVHLKDVSSTNEELIGTPNNGYMTKKESLFRNRPTKETKYCFIPEKYLSTCGVEMKGFESLKKWILLTSDFESVRGYTLSSEFKEWFEYPSNAQPQFITGKVKRGGPIKEKPKKREVQKKKRSFTYSDYDIEDSGEGSDYYFLMIGLILGLSIALLIGFVVYLLTIFLMRK